MLERMALEAEKKELKMSHEKTVVTVRCVEKAEIVLSKSEETLECVQHFKPG